MIIFVDGYSDTHITFRWETSSGMDFVPNIMQMHPQYILRDIELSESFTAYVAGMLPTTFHLVRLATFWGLWLSTSRRWQWFIHGWHYAIDYSSITYWFLIESYSYFITSFVVILAKKSRNLVPAKKTDYAKFIGIFYKWLKYYACSHWSIDVYRQKYVNSAVKF